MSPNFTKILFLVLFGLMSTKLVAQRDLIVTQAGEQIRCRILDETPSRFVYAYLGANNKVLRSEIFKNLVGSFKYNHFPADIVKQDKLPASNASSGDAPARIDTRKNNPSNNTKKTGESTQQPPKTGSNPPPVQKKPAEEPPKETKKPANNTEKTKEAAPKEVVKEKEQVAKTTEKPLSAKEQRELTGLTEPEKKSDYQNFMKYRVGIKAGLGNIINKGGTNTEAFGLYQEKLLKGWVIGGDAAYFITDNFGLGAVYTDFKSKNSSDKLTYPHLITGVTVTDGTLSNKISHKFVGPAFYVRKSIDFKTYVVLGLSPGMHFYTNKGQSNGVDFNFKGKSYGAAATLGLDFLLGNDITGRDIILSLEGGYNYGKINKLNFGDGRGDVALEFPVDLNRLDFSIGLRFMRFPGYLR